MVFGFYSENHLSVAYSVNRLWNTKLKASYSVVAVFVQFLATARRSFAQYFGHNVALETLDDVVDAANLDESLSVMKESTWLRRALEKVT